MLLPFFGFISGTVIRLEISGARKIRGCGAPDPSQLPGGFEERSGGGIKLQIAFAHVLHDYRGAVAGFERAEDAGAWGRSGATRSR